ncbi:hypothetical protein NHX12_028966, partial [Muraenolepis orangiensis]
AQPLHPVSSPVIRWINTGPRPRIASNPRGRQVGAHTTETTACPPPLPAEEGKVESLDQSDGERAEVAVVAERYGGLMRRKGHKHRSHRRVRSEEEAAGLVIDLAGWRRLQDSSLTWHEEEAGGLVIDLAVRRRLQDSSLTWQYSSKKSKHSSSSSRHKRKDERKHKKRHHRRQRSESWDRSSWRSSTESRQVEERDSGREESRAQLNQRDLEWRPAVKSVCKTAPQYASALSTGTILPLPFGDKLFPAEGNHGPRDYDSGNDTSSPPSSKNSVSRPSGIADNGNHCQDLASPDKQKFTERDNASDSGNSVTSYASLCRPVAENSSSSTFFNGERRRRERSVSRSPSRSSSCGSSRHSGHSSRGRSLSSCSSYSRSTSYSDARERRGSMASSSSRDSPDRPRERKRSSSYKEKDPKRRHKEGKRKTRRKSYSPMRKRRRDSPSHLEARRITSARKRPIPYFRPSPSSSCRSVSASSWSRSRSYRSNSRSSSWNSIFGTRSRRSRSPSYIRMEKSSKARR